MVHIEIKPLVTFQEWKSANNIAKAFHIGKAESEAVSALMTAVKPEVTQRLSDAVRARGMLRFIHHDVISKGLFSTNFTSAAGETESWKDQLRNREDGKLVTFSCIKLAAGPFLVIDSFRQING